MLICYEAVMSKIFDAQEFLVKTTSLTLRKNCPYSELFWSVFSPNVGKNADQNNSEYGHFSRSVREIYIYNSYSDKLQVSKYSLHIASILWDNIYIAY